MIEKYTKAILDNSPESIVLIGKNHEVLAFNKTFKNVLLKYFNREIKLGDFYYPDFVIEANHDIYLEFFNKALNGEATELQQLTQNKSAAFWFEYKTNPIYDEQDKLIGVALIAKDITAKKEAELEVDTINRRIKAILDNTNDSIILFSTTFEILAVNKSAIQFFNQFAHTEMAIGLDLKLFLTPGNLVHLLESYKQAINGSSVNHEVLFKTLEGLRWFSCNMSPIYNEFGELKGLLWITKNIHDKKKLEINLIESELKLRSFFDTAPVSVVVVNEAMVITDLNQETSNLFGYHRDELIDKPISILIPSRFHVDHSVHQHRYMQNPIPYKMGSGRYTPALTKNKTEIIVEISLNSFTTNNERLVVAIIQDVTQRVENEIAIKKHVEQLKEIAWIQAHKVRHPLSNILGIIELMKLENEADSSNFSYLEESANELDEIIRTVIKTAGSAGKA